MEKMFAVALVCISSVAFAEDRVQKPNLGCYDKEHLQEFFAENNLVLIGGHATKSGLQYKFYENRADHTFLVIATAKDGRRCIIDEYPLKSKSKK